MDEKSLRSMAKARAGFKRHFFVYLMVITFLGLINLVTSSEYLWFLWPAMGWGLGVSIHAYFTYVGGPDSLEESEYQNLKNKYSGQVDKE